MIEVKVSIVGGGSWGLALAKVLSDNNHETLVYDVNPETVKAINEEHRCLQLDEAIPESVRATGNVEEILAFSDILLFVVPTKVLREAICSILPHLETKKLFINAAKGIEPATFKRASEIFAEMVPPEYLEGFVALSGPSHAEEVIKGMMTAITSASENEEHACFVQSLFHNKTYFRVYSSTDLKGVELGGALKNIFALAAGIAKAQGHGDNALAALITRGLVEMGKIYEQLDASKDALLGLSGIGDLFVTCTSEHSRNYRAGLKIGSGKNLDETLDSITMVVEGIRTTEAAYELAKQAGIDTPIINAIHDVVFDRVEPSEAFAKLLSRTSKPERMP